MEPTALKHNRGLLSWQPSHYNTDTSNFSQSIFPNHINLMNPVQLLAYHLLVKKASQSVQTERKVSLYNSSPQTSLITIARKRTIKNFEYTQRTFCLSTHAEKDTERTAITGRCGTQWENNNYSKRVRQTDKETETQEIETEKRVEQRRYHHQLSPHSPNKGQLLSSHPSPSD